MTTGFGRRLALAAVMGALVTPAISAEKEVPSRPGRPIALGEVLSGELTALKMREPKQGKRVPTYQITSAPRRLPPPAGLCNLETGPETFQLVTSSEAQAAQLKALMGKEVAVRVDEVACAEDAGQMSEAVITKWSLVRKP